MQWDVIWLEIHFNAIHLKKKGGGGGGEVKELK